MVEIKKFYLILIPIIIFFSKTLLSSQIYDYQTDKFIEKIKSEILSVNKYNKIINYKILNDSFPNAFVTEDNTLFLTSGLFIYSPDYVSLLAVIAHEIGHLENYHVPKRKKQINNFKTINSIGNLVAIAGSMIMQQPELINTLIVNQTMLNNSYVKFTQDQEIEADIYAVKTLNNLKLPKDSVRKFLNILENKSKSYLVDEELKKFSTHPLFEYRYEILDSSENNNSNNFNYNLQKEFNFIRAKFIAYTKNEFSVNLKGDEKIYHDSIKNSLDGKLFESLKKINLLILKYSNNNFFIETKADILLSHGYKIEAVKFYKKVLNNLPNNNYIRFNIFLNSKFITTNKRFLEKYFLENINLIYLYPNNKDLIKKYYELSKILEYLDWSIFFEIILFENINVNKNFNELKIKTKDNNLKKIIKMYN